MGLREILIAFFAFGAIASALCVVFTRNTVYAALHFVGHLMNLAGLYYLLHAPLLAVLQVMVYAGAVMVLFLFAVMTLDMGEQERMPIFKSTRQGLGALVLSSVLLFLLISAAGPALKTALAPADATAQEVGVDNIARIARVLFRDMALTFEAVGLLLLTAVVAVMVMAKKKLES